MVDKPVGVSSHGVVNWARRVSGEKRVGHTGTLDPLASGLLIILVGRLATKRQAEFLHLPKTYLARAKLGWISDTYDVTGRLSPTADTNALAKITKQQVQTVLNQFLGKQLQQVPIFSAVKIRGQKLYQLARAGQTLSAPLPQRQVEITQITLTDWQPGKSPELEFETTVSSGTYIRSLIHDLGQQLKVGAVMSALRRTAIGSYPISQAKVCPYFLRR